MATRIGSRHERYLQTVETHIGDAVDAGVCRIRVQDEVLAGDRVTVGDSELVNFGSCAYMGLNVDPRLKQGAIAAIERFGPVFSSSTAYTSIDLYTDLEERLSRIFGAHVAIPTTTTLGHLSALPVLVAETDGVLVDVQAHASVHMGTQMLRAEGIPVRTVPHNDLDLLESAVAEASRTFDRVWYVADGVYSMYGDTAPVVEVAELMDRYPKLHVYYDDAHGFGWQGIHGRGYVLSRVPLHERMVLAVSLAKSFGTGGAALVFPTAAAARRVQVCGGTFTFSGPLHPAELGAAVASADIHLSPEQASRSERLIDQIEFVRSLLIERKLPIKSFARTPIWFMHVGSHDQVIELTTRLMADGFYVNPSAFPAVPMGHGGVRFTNTLFHQRSQIEGLVDALAHHLPLVTGSSGAETIDLRSLETSIVSPSAGRATGPAAS